MEIIVCIKRVPDAASRIEIDKTSLDVICDSWIMNPYDEFAVEEAVRIKERFGGKVTALNASFEGAEEILKKAVAMGADSAVYVKDPLLKGADGITTARALASAVSKLTFDIILCGNLGTDDSSGAVGPALSGLLNIAIVSSVKKLSLFPDENMAEALREAENGTELVECGLPALFTAQKGLNEPRFPSLSGIMRAKKEPIRYLGLDSLGIGAGDLYVRVKRERLAWPLTSRKAVILNGDLKGQVKEALRFLKEEVKVI